jgi:hypothetical protein
LLPYYLVGLGLLVNLENLVDLQVLENLVPLEIPIDLL